MQESTEADEDSLPGSKVVLSGFGLLDSSDIFSITRLNLKNTSKPNTYNKITSFSKTLIR